MGSIINKQPIFVPPIGIPKISYRPVLSVDIPPKSSISNIVPLNDEPLLTDELNNYYDISTFFNRYGKTINVDQLNIILDICLYHIDERDIDTLPYLADPRNVLISDRIIKNDVNNITNEDSSYVIILNKNDDSVSYRRKDIYKYHLIKTFLSSYNDILN